MRLVDERSDGDVALPLRQCHRRLLLSIGENKCVRLDRGHEVGGPLVDRQAIELIDDSCDVLVGQIEVS